MKFHDLFRCGENWCDTPGSTRTPGAVSSPEGGTGHQPALHTLSRQSCRMHLGRATAQDLRAALLAAVTLGMAQCCPLGKMEEQNSGNLWDRAIHSASTEGNSLFYLRNDTKASMVNPLFMHPERYILRWRYQGKLALPLIRRPLISSAPFYFLSSKASTF